MNRTVTRSSPIFLCLFINFFGDMIVNPILKIALRRARRGTGSTKRFLNRRTALQPLPIPNLNTILKEIPWALAGGLATRAYMPERVTQDIDIFIHADDESRARAAFRVAGYTLTETLVFANPSLSGFGVERGNEPAIDVIACNANWVDLALAKPSQDAAGFPVLPRPYLMLLKLDSARLRDLDDVQRMLRDTPTHERVSTRAVIKRYLPHMVEDYDVLIQLADIEFGAPN